jgi:hypothetical protein
MSLLQVSGSTALAFCLSHAAVIMGIITFYPPVHVEIYVPHPTIINGTIRSDNPGQPKNQITITSRLRAMPLNRSFESDKTLDIWCVQTHLGACIYTVSNIKHPKGARTKTPSTLSQIPPLKT